MGNENRKRVTKSWINDFYGGFTYHSTLEKQAFYDVFNVRFRFYT